MDSNFYHIDNLGEVFSLIIESGFRQEFFDNYDCDSNGDLIESIVKYLIRVNKVDDSQLEFDSESGMFAVYCEDEETILTLANLLEKSMYDDKFLDDAMNSEEVKEELGISENIADAVKFAKKEFESMNESANFFDRFNEIFRHD